MIETMLNALVTCVRAHGLPLDALAKTLREAAGQVDNIARLLAADVTLKN